MHQQELHGSSCTRNRLSPKFVANKLISDDWLESGGLPPAHHNGCCAKLLTQLYE